ncbi:MAG: putative baseplate assembly protein [Planctomycetaceae bacterium]|jgi:hypothetical protein
MTPFDSPSLVPGSTPEFAQDLLARIPAHLPDWKPAQGEPGFALVQIHARYLRALAERVNQAPAKNQLAFLDGLGINLLPAQAARAPLAFTPLPGIAQGRIPAGSRVGAAGLQGETILFETESAIALASASVAEIVSVWPGRDQCTFHQQAALADQPFTLFADGQPIPHEFYLGHDSHLALAGDVVVEIRFELEQASAVPLATSWDYWDGTAWRGFVPFAKPSTNEPESSQSIDGTAGFTRSGRVRLRSPCAESKPRTLGGIETSWIRCRLKTPLIPPASLTLPTLRRVTLRAILDRDAADLAPDLAFENTVRLDTSKPFRPFSATPAAGDVFYLLCDEPLSKPGATVTVALEASLNSAQLLDPLPTVKWQYWNGNRWTELSLSNNQAGVSTLSATGSLSFPVPSTIAPVELHGRKGFWIRALLVSGGYTRSQTFQTTVIIPPPPDKPNGEPTTRQVPITTEVPARPEISSLSIGYRYEPGEQPPRACLAWNDFRWSDLTSTLAAGVSSSPFVPVEDASPTVYFGFDQPLPVDRVGLYLGVREATGRGMGIPLRWEYWNGEQWRELAVDDETHGFALPGIVSLTWPGLELPEPTPILSADGTTITVSDPRDAQSFRPGQTIQLIHPDRSELVTIAQIDGRRLQLREPLSGSCVGGTLAPAPLARFGSPRTWVRARWREAGQPEPATIDVVRSNAVWGSQVQTALNEILGSGDGQPGQALAFRTTPVLEGEVIEVRELDGLRAEIELPMLLDDLRSHGLDASAVRTVLHRKTGRVVEAWVRWQSQPHLLFSGPFDRHYVVERATGRILFGDGVRGRPLPIGRDNVRATHYRSGGGLSGNVPAGALKQMLSGVPAKSVTNPRAAEGGADTETLAAVSRRGPRFVRHRRQAVTLADYEDLAVEASPAVAVARAIGPRNSRADAAAARLRIMIVPHSTDPQPWPSFQLRQIVGAFLRARMPAGLAGGLVIDGPSYHPIGVSATVSPVDPSEAGPTAERVQRQVMRFLHPLTGGPEGTGWPAGRDVYLSDLAALLEAVPGVDHLDELMLLSRGVPQGESVVVADDRFVVAGPVQIRLSPGTNS